MAKHLSFLPVRSTRCFGWRWRLGTSLICLLFLSATSCRNEQRATLEPEPTPRESGAVQAPLGAGPTADTTGVSLQPPKDVSIIELLAAPERFRGQRVRIIGYVTLEFEGTAVYLHEEDYLRTITRNALWLDVLRSDPPRLAGPGYAIVEGSYDPDRHGHMGLFSGGLTQVDRMTPWAGRQPDKQ